MAKLQKDIFLDVNTNYSYSGKELVSNLAAINNSIFNILSTPIGSRTFRPSYGSRLYQFIHDPVDTQTAVQIKTALVAALSKWEPRINVNFHASSVSQIQGGFSVHIVYSVPGISVSSDVSLSFVG